MAHQLRVMIVLSVQLVINVRVVQVTRFCVLRVIISQVQDKVLVVRCRRVIGRIRPAVVNHRHQHHRQIVLTLLGGLDESLRVIMVVPVRPAVPEAVPSQRVITVLVVVNLQHQPAAAITSVVVDAV